MQLATSAPPGSPASPFLHSTKQRAAAAAAAAKGSKGGQGSANAALPPLRILVAEDNLVSCSVHTTRSTLGVITSSWFPQRFCNFCVCFWLATSLDVVRFLTGLLF